MYGFLDWEYKLHLFVSRCWWAYMQRRWQSRSRYCCIWPSMWVEKHSATNDTHHLPETLYTHWHCMLFTPDSTPQYARLQHVSSVHTAPAWLSQAPNSHFDISQQDHGPYVHDHPFVTKVYSSLSMYMCTLVDGYGYVGIYTSTYMSVRVRGLLQYVLRFFLQWNSMESSVFSVVKFNVEPKVDFCNEIQSE